MEASAAGDGEPRPRPRPGAASTPQVRAACRGQPGRQVALAASRPGPGLIKDVEPNWSCQHLLRLRAGGWVGGRRRCCSAQRHSGVTLRRGLGGHVPKKIENQKRMGPMETEKGLFKRGHLVERRPMERTHPSPGINVAAGPPSSPPRSPLPFVLSRSLRGGSAVKIAQPAGAAWQSTEQQSRPSPRRK